MKVGTDGVVLGATADFSGLRLLDVGDSKGLRLLDVGAGTGLLSLMVKQRHPDATITAVEIDPDAAQQAQENFDASGWSIKAVCAPWQRFAADAAFQGETYDGIFCNPPYFTASLKNPSERRTMARHNDSLPFDELLQGVASLLSLEGLFYVILPVQDRDGFEAEALRNGLYLSKITYVHPVVASEAKRVVMCYKKAPGSILTEAHLYIETTQRNIYTEQFTALVKDFYLKL